MEQITDDLFDNLYIPESNNGILAINGSYYSSRQLNLDFMNMEGKKKIVEEICQYIKSNIITTLILNFKVDEIYFYKTETQLDLIFNILKNILLYDIAPFTIDINDNLFYSDNKLNAIITKLQEKNFVIKNTKIYLHHSLHNKDKQ